MALRDCRQAATVLNQSTDWILHGRDVPNWSKADALRLLQAIDTLACVKLMTDLEIVTS